jgi:hypothetical protein
MYRFGGEKIVGNWTVLFWWGVELCVTGLYTFGIRHSVELDFIRFEVGKMCGTYFIFFGTK